LRTANLLVAHAAYETAADCTRETASTIATARGSLRGVSLN